MKDDYSFKGCVLVYADKYNNKLSGSRDPFVEHLIITPTDLLELITKTNKP